MPGARRFNPHSAFSLIDLLLTLLIISIVTAIVLPKYTRANVEATGAILKTNVRIVREQLAKYRGTNTGWPAQIDPTWFSEGKLPEHPENSIGLAEIQVLANAGQPHPIYKVLKAGAVGAYWYNPIEGTFHARVAEKGSEANTLLFYNEVNGSSETSLGNYTGGGGGGS